jgi:hypothetical protein
MGISLAFFLGRFCFWDFRPTVLLRLALAVYPRLRFLLVFLFADVRRETWCFAWLGRD